MEPMKPISRRSFIEMALALGATAAWGSPFAKPSKIAWRERRDLYPEGVASGDPESESVLVWTRRPPAVTDVAEKLNVEIARAPEQDRLGFVLHLGDFIYEIVWYPEDRPQGMYDRRIRDLVRYQHGEKIRDFHIPTVVDDYRAVYRAYLHDPDLQDARARWPFVAMWDNHEFSWLGWQSLLKFGGETRPAQTRKVAANQAWFEYQPARIKRSTGKTLERFDPPRVVDTPITRFDAQGLGQEPNNLAAIASLTGYRALRWGRNVDLIITDQHSYRSEEPTDRPEAAPLSSDDFPNFIPQEAQEILDAGRDYAGGHAPATIRFGAAEVPNF